MKKELENQFRAYHKHYPKEKAKKHWKNLKVCETCEFKSEYLNRSMCEVNKKNLMMQIEMNCPKEKF